jgi:Flp pilus assembly protein TadB
VIPTNLFNLPSFVLAFIPFIGAGALGWAAYVFGGKLDLRIGKPQSVSRVEEMFSVDTRRAKTSAAPVGSSNHRIRIAFKSIGIDASGSEESYLLFARLVIGVVMCIALMLIGLPFLTSLTGFAGGWVFADSWVKRAWSKTRTEIEAELPALLMRLSSTIQASPNIPSAMEVVAKTLKANGPLRTWTLDTASRMHSEGYSVMEQIRESAAGISTSLSIAAELIGRMWTTGGEGYGKAFGSAADNLESVLDARVLARAKGGSAQGTVNILTGMTFFMIAFMMRSDAMAATVNMPLVQIVYAVLCLVIVFGHSQVSEIIDTAV